MELYLSILPRLGRLQPYDGNAASIGRDYTSSIPSWYSCWYWHRPPDALTRTSHLAWRSFLPLLKPLVTYKREVLKQHLRFSASLFFLLLHCERNSNRDFHTSLSVSFTAYEPLSNLS